MLKLKSSNPKVINAKLGICVFLQSICVFNSQKGPVIQKRLRTTETIIVPSYLIAFNHFL